MSIATMILEQIKALDPRATWAWGAKDFVATKNGLMFKSSGMVRWKGFVHITLDEGQDLYNIEFFKMRGVKRTVAAKVEGIFADQLVELIDSQVG